MSEQGIDDLTLLTPDLASLGWTDELDQWADSIAEEADPSKELIKGRLARTSRGFSLVFTGGDAILAASGSDRAELEEAPATGDYVLVSDDPTDGPAIAAVATRQTALRRRAPGRVPTPQVLAANVQIVFVMHGLDRPLNVRRIERQLVVAWDSGAVPVVVLTKADTVDDAASIVAEVEAVAPGVEALAISTETGVNIDRITRWFDANTSVALMGLSGIGKSSLVNTLSQGRVQRTGEVRAGDRRGRHTTVTRDLIPLPDGGFVIDAPGVREIGLWQAYEGLDKTFIEIAEAAATCRFSDCEHEAEPGCEVRSALEAGAIAERRIEHWRELRAELQLQESQLEEFARRTQSRDRADAEDQRDQTRSNRKSRNRGKRRGPRR